jgi:hypothetical protein
VSTACLIGRPTGRAAMKAVYCHWDGNPPEMAPVLRRLVLETFDGRPAAAAHYLFAYSGFGYWSTLTGSGDAYSAAMRADSANGPVHKWTGQPWPLDVDVYQDHPESSTAVLEYRDGGYVDSALLAWPQRWLYIIYPQVLAVVRYVAPDDALGTRLPLGINCEALPWADSVNPARLLNIEQRANQRVEELLAARTHPGRAVAA